jgi:CheY-like chemotaxis protein
MEHTSPIALVVDDSPVVRRYIRARLESGGWAVAEANDAFEGLSMVREMEPDLITLDLIMPINNGIDGLHLARLISEEHPEITLLIVSGMASAQDVQGFLNKHKLEFFGKTEPTNGGFARLFARTDDILHELHDYMLLTAKDELAN